MRVTVHPGSLAGCVQAPPSKSYAHRLLICAALADGETILEGAGNSRDIEATARCLAALGADIRAGEEALHVRPIREIRKGAVLDCGESGSTLRFLLPLAALLDCGATLTGCGRLPQRPNGPLIDAMRAHGARFAGERLPLTVSGGLRGGEYHLPGDVSSQYFTGLLLALPLLDADSELIADTPLESAPYIDLTLSAMRAFGVAVQKTEKGFFVPGRQRYKAPGRMRVEGDWSGAAFWLAANALGSAVTVEGLQPDSAQGDRAAQTLFRPESLDCVDVRDVPDLMPALAAVMAAVPGDHRITGAARLRIKESDRLCAMANVLRALGGNVEELPDGLRIVGCDLAGGTVDGFGDHRIVMSAAILATVCQAPVTIEGAEAADKSYPGFFEDFAALGGKVETEPAGKG